MGVVKIPLLDRLVSERSGQLGEQSLSGVVDRLHSLYTVIVLSVFAATVGFKQYIGSPVDCIIPKHNDKRNWRSYILEYCFVKGMHRYDPIKVHQMNATSLSAVDQVDYYQWVPLFLGFQVICFMAPHYFWTWAQSFLYIDMSTIVKESSKLTDTSMLKSACREKQLDKISDYIFVYFRYRKLARRGSLSWLLHRPFIFTTFYLVTKLFYLANSICQIVLITYFLGFEAHWGLNMLPYLLSPSASGLSFDYFPIKAKCIYEVIGIGTTMSHHAECLLPINYINEKIFPLIWLWLLLLSVASFVDVLFFAATFFRTSYHFSSVLSLIKDRDVTSPVSAAGSYADSFVKSFLGADGVLLFEFILENAGSLAARDVCTKVWHRYCRSKGFRAVAGGNRPRKHTESSRSDYTGQ